MIISMIAAMTRNRVIGKENDIPWHLPDDFQYFKKTTSGHHVIMGRKNYDSLPPKFKPLPGRPNLVVTRNRAFTAEGVQVFHTVEDSLAFAKANGEQEVFIIGGGEIYKIGLSLCDKIYLTEIDGTVDGDTHFPEFDRKIWKETSRIHHPIDHRHAFAFDFVIFQKH